ncbi:MAG: amino acid permease, partial [Haliea sp.]
MAATRLLFAQGRGGLLPHWFAAVHPVHHTPMNAILFVGSIAIIGPFIGKTGLSVIVSSGATVFTMALVITVAAALRLRRTCPEMKRPYRIGLPTMWLALLVGVFLVLLMVVPGSPGQLGPTEFAVIVIWASTGVLFNYLRRRHRDLSIREQNYLILGAYK